MRDALRQWGGARVVPIIVAALVYAGGLAFAAVAQPVLIGDEPHYLVYATSLGHGWGVNLRSAYREVNRRSFYAGVDTHARVTPDGKLVTWHGAGLPVLLAPFASRERTPGEFRAVMVLFSALLSYHLYQLVVRAARVPPRIAALSVLVLMLSPPLIVYASQVYPETVAALLVVLAFRALASSSRLEHRLTGAAAAAALLPWFNVRYGTITMALGVVIAGAGWVATEGRGARRLMMAVASLRGAIAAGLLIGGALVGFHFYLYDAAMPPSGDTTGFYTLANLYPFGAGPFLDSASGLLPMAPVLIIAVVAIPTAARQLGTLATVGAVAVAVGYCGYNGYFGTAGESPPGRYVASVVPLLALPLAVVLSGGGRILYAGTAAAIVAGLVTTVESARHFRLLYSANRTPFSVMRVMEPFWPVTVNPRYGDLDQVAEQMTHDTGTLETVDGTPYLLAREGRDPIGRVAFAHHVPLRHGRYRVTVDLLLGAPAEGYDTRHDDTPAVLIEVLSEGEPLARVVHELPERGIVESAKILEFSSTVPGRAEVRVQYGGRGMLGVGRISSELVMPLPMRDAERERWKSAAWAVGLIAAAGVWRWKARGR